jgi:hypothetical protein
MITLPGQLIVKTIYGQYGPFKVGRLSTSVCIFVVKDTILDQYDEGKYEGEFVIEKIKMSRPYFANGLMMTELRAVLHGMTLSKADGLSGDEAQKLTPQEPDPVDEETPASVPATPPAQPKAKPRRARDPLVDTTPFGIETDDSSAADSANEAGKVLFGALWPLADVVKIDPTVDRRVFREQCARLDELGYTFACLSQDWHRPAPSSPPCDAAPPLPGSAPDEEGTGATPALDSVAA